MTNRSTEPVADAALHRRLGIEAFNATWELLDGRDYDEDREIFDSDLAAVDA